MKTRVAGASCIIPYTSDRERVEGAGVGVLLFSPEHHFINALLSSSNDRVRRFFRLDGNQSGAPLPNV